MQALKGHYQLVLLSAVVFLLWTTPVFLPLRLLVIFLHELSHAIAAWATGGSVVSLTVSWREGGEALVIGGSRFLGLSAGYLGSLLWGVALFLIALRTNADRLVVAFLGGLMLLITALYMRDAFAVVFGALSGVAMLGSARFLGHLVNDLLLRVIGLASMIYVPGEIFSDTIARSHLRSDARMLAEEFGGPTLFWGGLWLVLSLAVIGLCLRYGLGRDSNLWRGRPTPGANGP
jgi:hypothetical protein